jgi:hypothetical protein
VTALPLLDGQAAVAQVEWDQKLGGGCMDCASEPERCFT